jgi:hypothetical protein
VRAPRSGLGGQALIGEAPSGLDWGREGRQPRPTIQRCTHRFSVAGAEDEKSPACFCGALVLTPVQPTWTPRREFERAVFAALILACRVGDFGSRLMALGEVKLQRPELTAASSRHVSLELGIPRRSSTAYLSTLFCADKSVCETSEARQFVAVGRCEVE